MATILCFGDSNTWGTSANDMSRYDEPERWTGLLAKLLSNKHNVIEAGQPNRTLVNHFPFTGDKSGITYLKPYLIVHQPELVVIMLGTNDLKSRFNLTPENIAKSMAALAENVMDFTLDKGEGSYDETFKEKSKVLIISPPPIFEVGAYVDIYAGGAEKSRSLASCYENEVIKLGCDFFDAGLVVVSCEKEGVHWHKDQHLLFAQAIYTKIVSILCL